MSCCKSRIELFAGILPDNEDIPTFQVELLLLPSGPIGIGENTLCRLSFCIALLANYRKLHAVMSLLVSLNKYDNAD